MNEADLLKTVIQAGVPAALLILLVWRGVPALAAFASSFAESQRQMQVALADLGATMRGIRDETAAGLRGVRDETAAGLARVEDEIRDLRGVERRTGAGDRRSSSGAE